MFYQMRLNYNTLQSTMSESILLKIDSYYLTRGDFFSECYGGSIYS